MLLGVALFVVLLLFSILLHEAGHLVFAKRFGMKATEYFAGFGPKVFSFKRGETEYGLKAVPLGGYVKILGMSPSEEISPEDLPRAFWKQSIPKRATVIIAGSLTHLVLAFILLWVAVSALGTPAVGNRVGEVLPCLEEECSAAETSPAEAAGIRPGDRILAIGDVQIEDWLEDSAAALEGATGTIPVTVLRDGEELTLPVALGEPTRGDRARMGVVMTYENVREGPLEGAGTAVQQVGELLVGSFQGLANLPAGVVDTVQATFGDEERGLEDPIGVVGIGRISGEIGSVEAVPTSAKVALVLLLVAGANVFFAVFNLLPIPPLDGGHLAVMGAEAVRKRYAHWKGRPEPGAIAPEVLTPVTLVVIVLFLSLTLLLLVADIFEPVTLR